MTLPITIAAFFTLIFLWLFVDCFKRYISLQERQAVALEKIVNLLEEDIKEEDEK
ncbi:MAG: hypothetical protein WC459_04035 [Patescibacteria group bacterium]